MELDFFLYQKSGEEDPSWYGAVGVLKWNQFIRLYKDNAHFKVPCCDLIIIEYFFCLLYSQYFGIGLKCKLIGKPITRMALIIAKGKKLCYNFFRSVFFFRFLSATIKICTNMG